MSISTKHAVVFLLLLVMVLASGIHASERNWELEVGLSKQTYVLYEPIWLDVTLTNNTSDTLRTHGLRHPNHRQFTIVVKDHNGDSVEYSGPLRLLTATPGHLLLAPGEQDSESFNLLELFGSDDHASGYNVLYWIFPHMPLGTYSVQVQFEDAVSDELTFDVVEPCGMEEQVLELIQEASSTYIQNDRDSCVQRFGEIVTRFPTSVFAEQCFRFSKMYSHETQDRKSRGTFDGIGFIREMLTKYPNSGRSKGWLVAVARELEDDEKMAVFDYFIEDKANTRAARYAKLLRDRLLRKQARERGE